MSVKAPSKSDAGPIAAAIVQHDKSCILVVDDHPIVREGLVRVIDQTGDLVVCGQAEGIPQALAVIEESKPALVIVTWTLRSVDKTVSS